AHELERRGCDAEGCILCAARPPYDIDDSRCLSSMNDEQLRSRWTAMLPEGYREVGDAPALFDILSPIIRADILAYESCVDLDVRLERTPVLAIAAQADAMVPVSSMQRWREMGPSVELATIDAGHLFVLSHAEQTARLVVSFVRKRSASCQATAARNRR